ncbi:leucine Rich repeat-containing domain protein [Ancylostoma ceylanicum]|uniref:Leucine Rich repeat-containing domain protein n=1 Tax=Ancylostoma ceylanicum TaxID=53326 RepID=A0A0D6M5A6_9BILA|nr:leucine Rich repeat-containing domain protein [Ancylostoma ceylanicum]
MEALEEVFRRVQFDTLDFEYTFLDDDVIAQAAISLSEMFEFYESALKLNLSFNKQITIRGWTDVFKAVKNELYLGENSIQSADGAHLYQLILNNFTIQMIDLRNNQLGDGGVAKMCEALRNPEVIKKSSLTALVLWNNKITAAGMDSIAAALCENPHLETLNIGSNQLGEAGVQRLRPALGGNGSNLRRLGLQNTQMTCQSAILLAECLADNSTLIRVDLRDNPGIGSAGLLAIHSAMKINGSISLLNLDQSCIVATNVKVSDCAAVQVRAYQEDFRRYYEDIKRYCERNKLAAQQKSDESPEVATVEATVKSEEPDGGEEDTPSSSAPPGRYFIFFHLRSKKRTKVKRISMLTEIPPTISTSIHRNPASIRIHT